MRECGVRLWRPAPQPLGPSAPPVDLRPVTTYSNAVSSLIWAVLGLLLILSEFFIPEFLVFFFGAGALLNALLVIVVPGLANRLPLQLVIWAVTSGLSLAFLRKYAARWFRGENIGADDETDVGKTAKVLEEIAPDSPGRITLHGTSWKATTFDETIPVGRTVTILKRENLSYIVTAGDLLNGSPLNENPPGDGPRNSRPHKREEI